MKVEASHKIETENSFTNKSFEQIFNISNCDMTDITSTLSNDGILTITAQKNVSYFLKTLFLYSLDKKYFYIALLILFMRCVGKNK